tara:strand:- start:1359 stop:1586 length:228 start_codon:yes stop_codon:yes gene_type:complete
MIFGFIPPPIFLIATCFSIYLIVMAFKDSGLTFKKIVTKTLSGFGLFLAVMWTIFFLGGWLLLIITTMLSDFGFI